MINKRALFVCYAGSEFGIGHLSRLLSVALQLKKRRSILIDFLIISRDINKKKLKKFSYELVFLESDLISEIEKKINKNSYDLIVYDLFKEAKLNNIGQHLKNIRKKGIKIIAIDCLVNLHKFIDLVWIPSFYFPLYQKIKNINYGWGCYLLQKKNSKINYKDNDEIIILTGGSDTAKLGDKLPAVIDDMFQIGQKVTWVQGPYASSPIIPENNRLNWKVEVDPDDLHNLILQSKYALVTYGVSFFEVIQYGIPTVVFAPYSNHIELELDTLKEYNVCKISSDYLSAASALLELTKNSEYCDQISKNAKEQMKQNGVIELSNKILDLVGEK